MYHTWLELNKTKSVTRHEVAAPAVQAPAERRPEPALTAKIGQV
jgi:hypothetical protein